METNYIDLKQERDFGEIFSATFSFIKQESKRLGLAILYYVLPVLLLASVFMVFVGKEQQQMMRGFSDNVYSNPGNPFANFGNMMWYLLLTMLLYAVALTSLKCTIYGYMKLYAEKGRDGFELQDIWKIVQQKFLPVLGISILIGIIIGVGFMFCLIPGIYFATSLTLIFMAFFYEGKGFSDAFSRSFDLTKEAWWLTLGLLVIVYLMLYAITMLFSIPAMIAGMKPMFSQLQNPEAMDDFVFPLYFYIMNSIIYIITYTLTAVPAIMFSIHYFSLVEKKEKPSLEAKIEQISKDA